MSDKNVRELAEALAGTSGAYDESFSRFYRVDIDDLEELMAEYDLHRCSRCGWWENDCHELEEEIVCDDCLEENERDA